MLRYASVRLRSLELSVGLGFQEARYSEGGANPLYLSACVRGESLSQHVWCLSVSQS